MTETAALPDLSANLEAVRRRALAALRPPPRLRLSEWIEREVYLPEAVSAAPGPIRLWPFQADIADAIGDPDLERVTLVKPVRVGFTTLLTGALAGYVANEPAPILSLQPTDSDARDYIVSEVEPIFESSPELRGLLTQDVGDEKRNTLMHRRFPGGSLKVVAAKAPRNLRRHTARILFVDEADAMETGPEGSPITLAERRTLSFPDRKIVVGSTPTFEATSNVLRLYAQSDQRVFEVPCPECGTFFEILWAHIQWPEGRPEDAYCVCPECSGVIEERLKPALVTAGRWRATAPEVTGHAGFRLNALVSPLANASWGKLAQEFVAAKDRPDQLQTFVNTILAQGWRENAEEIDETDLAARAEDFGLDSIPEDVIVLTAGVDVQHDRLELTIAGHDRGGTLYVLGHVTIWGSVREEATWRELDELLTTRWPHPAGDRIGIDAAVVDSGDGATVDYVYAFCRPRAGRRIMAGKGASGSRPAIAMGNLVQGCRVWVVGVDGIKSSLFARLASGRSVRFSRDLEPVWYEQLASERAVVRYSRGQPQRRFERIPGRRAEALDCVVYAIAARGVVTVNPDTRLEELSGRPSGATAPPRRVKSKWLSGNGRSAATGRSR